MHFSILDNHSKLIFQHALNIKVEVFWDLFLFFPQKNNFICNVLQLQRNIRIVQEKIWFENLDQRTSYGHLKKNHVEIDARKLKNKNKIEQ